MFMPQGSNIPSSSSSASMPPPPTRQNSAKIADVLEAVQNPMTPGYAKEQTLRKLDGLDSRRKSLSGRRMSQGQSDCIASKEKFRRSNSEAAFIQRGERPANLKRPTDISDGKKHVNFLDPYTPVFVE